MADNLPLIPEKGSACSDVQPVLRRVFRSLRGLPPLAGAAARAAPVACEAHAAVSDDGDHVPPLDNYWTESYTPECKELRAEEEQLREEQARRLCRAPITNSFALRTRRAPPAESRWRLRRGLLQRSDLVPTIQQNAGRDGSLWVKNILNGSSGDLTVTAKKVNPIHHRPPVLLGAPSDFTMQTLSIGEAAPRAPAPPPPARSEPPPPKYVVCIPPQLDFVNFTVGQLHAQTLRLLNLSKFELRLAVAPPPRRELSVALGGRGLGVSAGAAAELRVRFRPRDVRALRALVRVRVSRGAALAVPVACYMEPPLLRIGASASSGPSARAGEPRGPHSGALDLGSRLLGDAHAVCLDIHCGADHASFFLLAEDSWLSYNLDVSL